MHRRCVEPSPAFWIVKMVATPPAPGGDERSRPPTPFAFRSASFPRWTRALRTAVGPAGASRFEKEASTPVFASHGAGRARVARFDGEST
ncbi:MAG TPA: hypothetical protein VFD92_10360 [Candidatus Binatia bacterium]|nr:hypothetical protein [Candidatus Binatia bacterium]